MCRSSVHDFWFVLGQIKNWRQIYDHMFTYVQCPHISLCLQVYVHPMPLCLSIYVPTSTYVHLSTYVLIPMYTYVLLSLPMSLKESTCVHIMSLANLYSPMSSCLVGTLYKLSKWMSECPPVSTYVVISTYSFIHSGHFYSTSSSPLLLRGALDYSTDTVSEFHAEAHRQLQVKDLPKVPTWQLERESNPRLSGWKSSSQPRRHHVPHVL